MPGGRPPGPVVRNVQPPVIGQRGGQPPAGGPRTFGPNMNGNPNGRGLPQTGRAPGMPGVRSNNVMNSPAGKAGMDTRGVFGTRASKLGGTPQSSTIAGGSRAAGVRSPKIKSGGEQLNRGVIRGAKQATSGAGNGGFGAGNKGGKRRDEREAVISSSFEEEGLFNVDQTVVPGVIRGWTPPAEQQHTAGPAFGERPGKFRAPKKKNDFDDDDW